MWDLLELVFLFVYTTGLALFFFNRNTALLTGLISLPLSLSFFPMLTLMFIPSVFVWPVYFTISALLSIVLVKLGENLKAYGGYLLIVLYILFLLLLNFCLELFFIFLLANYKPTLITLIRPTLITLIILLLVWIGTRLKK